MMKLSYKILCRSLLIVFFSLSLGSSGVAQVNNTLYFMHGVPQANRVNPAYQPKGNLYIGIPFLSSIRTGLSSSSLAWEDLIYQHPTEPDSLITSMYNRASQEVFLNKLKPVNVVSSDLGTSLISFGFRTEVGFFTLDVITRWDGSLYYPGDLARLMITGAPEGERYELDGVGTDLMAFDEISVGWSGEILDNLTIGARAKVLFGIGNLSTLNSDLSVTTSEEAWNIQSDMRFNASLPFAEVTYDEDGMIDEVVINDDLENPNFSSISRYMFNAKNLGFGVDLGIEYRPIDPLQICVSLVDLGYIRWKDEVHQIDYSTGYDFTGFELNPFDLSEDYSIGDHLDSAFNQMADSLIDFLEFTPGVIYSKRLNTKLYAGASWSVTPKINFGLLSRTDFLNGKVSEQVTASANFTTGRVLNLTLSYSYMNAYFKNIGGGFSINAGPVNLYLISDNLLSAAFWPEEARSINFWFGLNLTFGYKEKVDYPLVW
ncbi:MAG: hypothetical protein GY790_15895 [Bacteroidetes bacterium]|nr:hypothetical protein [Bacteroidota bacterium]